MNVAFFIKPKAQVAYLYDENTLRQGLEKLKNHGYASIPVVDKKNRYVGTVSEGDFLWCIINLQKDIKATDIRDLETMRIKDVLDLNKNPPARITDTVEELITKAETQNFIPVVDDRDVFIGIVTRRDIIHYFNEHMTKAQ